MDKKWMRSFGANRLHTRKERMQVLQSAEVFTEALLAEGLAPLTDVYPERTDTVAPIEELGTLAAVGSAVSSKSLYMASSTLRTYRYKVGVFISWLESNGFGEVPVGQFSRENVLKFFDHLRRMRTSKGKAIFVTTENNHRTMVEGIFAWLGKKVGYTGNP